MRNRQYVDLAALAWRAMRERGLEPDFPPDALSPFGIRAVDPSQFLIGLFHIDPIGVTHAIERQALEIKTPISALHERLAANVPDFARLLVAAKPEPRPYL